MTYLVDINIISELCRREPDRGVLDWADSGTRIAVSVISVDEIFFGIAWRPNARILNRFGDTLNEHNDGGFSLAAAVRIPGWGRASLEQLLRYCTRDAVESPIAFTTPR